MEPLKWGPLSCPVETSRGLQAACLLSLVAPAAGPGVGAPCPLGEGPASAQGWWGYKGSPGGPAASDDSPCSQALGDAFWQSPRDSPSLSPDATQAGRMPTLAGSGIPLLPRILFQVEAMPLSGAQPAHPFPAPAGGAGVLPGTTPSVTASTSSPHPLSAPLPTRYTIFCQIAILHPWC